MSRNARPEAVIGSSGGDLHGQFGWFLLPGESCRRTPRQAPNRHFRIFRRGLTATDNFPTCVHSLTSRGEAAARGPWRMVEPEKGQKGDQTRRPFEDAGRIATALPEIYWLRLFYRAVRGVLAARGD